jgi:hypothetical protein
VIFADVTGLSMADSTLCSYWQLISTATVGLPLESRELAGLNFAFSGQVCRSDTGVGECHADGTAEIEAWNETFHRPHSRTAPSRTSGENLFDLFMASFSQELKPPQNLGRFSHLMEVFAVALVR